MSSNLKNFHEIGKKIEKFIRPATFPLAVKLIKSKSEIPANAKRPNIDLKTKNFICQNFKMARTYGWTIAVTEEDCNCMLARGVYGWDPVSEDMMKWKRKFEVGLYSKDEATSRKIEKHIYLLENKFLGLVISPLSWKALHSHTRHYF